jgi:hypothetical protein
MQTSKALLPYQAVVMNGPYFLRKSGGMHAGAGSQEAGAAEVAA